LKNYYFVLGLSIYARDSEIKNAYRKLALAYHPDRNPSAEAEGMIKEINEAHEVLSDPEKKLLYDQMLVGIEPPTAPSTKSHRDPRYRPKPPGYVRTSKKMERYEFMQRNAPITLTISKITLVCCLILLIDFILPAKKEAQKVAGIYGVHSRESKGSKIQTEDGRAYQVGPVIPESMSIGSRITVFSSPLLSVVKRLEREPDFHYRVGASIYGNLIFFPVIWLITSLLGVYYAKKIEFGFNLGVMNALLVVFNLLIFIVSL
jgi:DnaJ domain